MLPACITARAVMHCGIANPRWRGKRPGIPDACTTRNITYLARGPCWECLFGMSSITLFVNDWENFSRANNSFKLMFARISYFLNRQQCGWNKNMEIVTIPKKACYLKVSLSFALMRLGVNIFVSLCTATQKPNFKAITKNTYTDLALSRFFIYLKKERIKRYWNGP